MFQVHEDNSIYVTRGDVVFLRVKAEKDGRAYTFEAGEVLRIKVFGKKNAENVVLQKDFPVTAATGYVDIILTEEDTKIGEVISKPKDYWYEVELNPYDNPQTIIGYDEDGPKVFRLFPEGDDIPEYVPDPEVIKVIDTELDMTSERPVQNQVIARAFANLQGGYQAVYDAVAKLHVTPEMYGAVGDGVANDYDALKKAVEACNEIGCSLLLNGDYKIETNVGGNLFTLCPEFIMNGDGKITISDNLGEYESIFYIPDCAGVRISDITVDQNSQGNVRTENPKSGNNQVVFKFVQGSDCIIKNVTFLNVCGTWTIEGNGVNNFTVDGCRMLDAGIGQTLRYDTSNFYFLGSNVIVANNYFKGSGLGVTTAIEVEGTHHHILNNYIENFYTGIIIATTSPEATAHTKYVNNNTINGCQYGVALWAMHKDLEKIHITNNNITVTNMLNNGDELEQCVGVYFYYPSKHNFREIYVCRNNIKFLNVSTKANIHSNGVDCAVYHDDTTKEASDIVITDNIIEKPYGAGVYFSYRGICKDIRIERNNIKTPHNCTGTDALNGGIVIGADIRGLDCVTIKDNIIRDHTDAGVIISGRSGVDYANNIACENNNTTGLPYIISGSAVGMFVTSKNSIKYDYIGCAVGSKQQVGAKVYEYGETWHYVGYTDNKPKVSGAAGDVLIDTRDALGTPIKWIYLSDLWLPIGQKGYRRWANSGAPTTLIPYFVGEECYNTADKSWYKAVGESVSDWRLVVR